MIILDYKSTTPLYIQIYESIKQDIILNQLKADDKLPSIRALSIDLKVSVKTVQNAYEQLLMEGYIDSYERSGFFVLHLEHPIESKQVSSPVEIIEANYINTGITKDAFDYKLWKKTINRVLNDVDLTTLSIINGEPELKKQIIRFAQEYRGLDAHYNQIIIGSSTEVLLIRLLELIDNPNVAYESPGYEKAERVFQANAKTKPIDVFKGIDLDELKKVNTIYTSPSHQYPFGTIMPINERLKMIEWARVNKAFIIEDDYNSVLRYSGNPIPSLQGLDNHDVVVYLGSFSNMMFPSINISYMVLPKSLLKKHEQSKNKYNQTVSKLEQLTLAKFMEDGHFAKHLRKIKKLYSKKSEIIQDTLNNYDIESVETSAGTHIVIKVPNVDRCIIKAKQLSITMTKISDEYVLLRYRGLSDEEIPSLIEDIFKQDEH